MGSLQVRWHIVEQVSLYVDIMMVLQLPHKGFPQAMFEKLLELIEVLGDVQYLAPLSKTS